VRWRKSEPAHVGRRGGLRVAKRFSHVWARARVDQRHRPRQLAILDHCCNAWRQARIARARPLYSHRDDTVASARAAVVAVRLDLLPRRAASKAVCRACWQNAQYARAE
jgi:hypothetical protein